MRSNCALVIAHPGHELRVYGWAVEARPEIQIFTDGSGSLGTSRIPSARSLAAAIHADCGPIFPAGTDADLYSAMLNSRAEFFIGIAESLTRSFVRREVEAVVADAAEGFNPTHDLCRATVDLAVTQAERVLGRSIASYEFCLTETADGKERPHENGCLDRRLDDSVFAGKLREAHGYIGLSNEVAEAIGRFGSEYFRHEHLCPVRERFRLPDSDPHYESVGKARVDAGSYAMVVRHDEHILPIVQSLRERVTGLVA